jgi:hypothetical protein
VAILRDHHIILLKILRIEVLKIRSQSYSGDAKLIAAVSNHIHNIPEIIISDDLTLLQYYMDVEVPAYVSDCGPRPILEPLWESLRAVLKP